MYEIEKNTMKKFGKLEKNVLLRNGWRRGSGQNAEAKISKVTSKKAKVLSVLIVFWYWGDGILWLSVDFHY